MSTETELKELASRLEAKEAEIATHIEALQDELENAGDQIKGLVKNNPWVALGGSLLAGLAVGLLVGKGGPSKSKEDNQEDFASRLAEMALRAGLSDYEVASLVRDAMRERESPASYAGNGEAKKGIIGRLFGMAADVGLNMAKKQLVTYLESVLAGTMESKEAEKDAS